jgi:hypothetical protein
MPARQHPPTRQSVSTFPTPQRPPSFFVAPRLAILPRPCPSHPFVPHSTHSLHATLPGDDRRQKSHLDGVTSAATRELGISEGGDIRPKGKGREKRAQDPSPSNPPGYKTLRQTRVHGLPDNGPPSLAFCDAIRTPAPLGVWWGGGYGKSVRAERRSSLLLSSLSSRPSPLLHCETLEGERNRKQQSRSKLASQKPTPDGLILGSGFMAHCAEGGKRKQVCGSSLRRFLSRKIHVMRRSQQVGNSTQTNGLPLEPLPLLLSPGYRILALVSVLVMVFGTAYGYSYCVDGHIPSKQGGRGKVEAHISLVGR